MLPPGQNVSQGKDRQSSLPVSCAKPAHPEAAWMFPAGTIQAGKHVDTAYMVAAKRNSPGTSETGRIQL